MPQAETVSPTAAEPARLRAHVVVADPSWLLRDGISRVLTEIEPSCTIQTAADGSAFHEVLRSSIDLTLVVVGMTMVGDEEETLFRHIQKLAPRAVIAVIGDAFEHENILKAVYYGALGVICTGDAREVVSAALARLLVGEVAIPLPASQPAGENVSRHAASDVGALTPRERDVFAHLGKGLSVLLIADRLLLSPHTVRVHIARIMKKLDLRDRSALMHRAVSHNALRSAARSVLAGPPA